MTERRIMAGFGYRAGAEIGSLRGALYAALSHGTLGQALHGLCHGLCAPADKAQAPALRDLAAELNLPIHPMSADALRGTPTPTDSARVRQLRGTGSVAEACALLAVGRGGYLIVPRQVSADGKATCALAAARGTKRANP